MNIITNINKYFNKLIGLKHKFNNPSDIAIGSDGTFYITDTDNHVICKVIESGDIEVYAGKVGVSGHNDGNRLGARFHKPIGITIDKDNNLYVTDYGNNLIRCITVDGNVKTIAGTPKKPGIVDGDSKTALFYAPCGITISKNNVIYVSDTGSHLIRKIIKKTLDNYTVRTIAGSYTGMTGEYVDGLGKVARFSHPRGITIDDNDNLYIADSYNNCIRLITPDGIVSTFAGNTNEGHADGLKANATFNGPYGIAIHNNNIYLTDTYNKIIRLISNDGQVSTIPNITLSSPYGIGINNKNNIIVIDRILGIIKI